MKIISILLLFVSYMLFSTANWIPHKFGKVTYEQIMFHLHVPLEAETKLIFSYLQNTVMVAVLLSIVLFFVMRKVSPKKCVWASLFLLCLSFCWMYYKIGMGRIMEEYHDRATMGNFYEKHYVDSHKVKITAPEHKRNLVLIFAESFETAYAKEEYFDVNLIPEMQALAENNLNFSDNDNFGGFYAIYGAQYTQASLIAQLCAVPLRLPVNFRRYRPQNGFLPGALCLTDILAKDGYNQSFLSGMTKIYAGTDKFVETHGNVKILDWDFYSTRDKLDRNSDPQRKRIVRDAKLFDYAKEELTALSQKDKPFSLILMTMDTHFGNEYFSKENCPIKYHDESIPDAEYFKNVVSCASLLISSFVEWIKAQPFYENTEIVVVGDHPTMNSVIFNGNMERRVYNAYINADMPANVNPKNRQFTALDTMPTLLEGLGYTIDGRKLGLGVSLFSGKKTLLEKVGLETLDNELEKQSKIYNGLLYGKEI